MAWWQRTYRRVMYGRPVIVVSGLPQSGTSMMMKMLEAGGVPVWLDGVRTPDDQNPKGYYELERVKQLDKGLDKSWVRAGRGRAVKVISSLLEHLPPDNNYHVVFMNRDIQEVLNHKARCSLNAASRAAQQVMMRFRSSSKCTFAKSNISWPTTVDFRQST